MRPRELENILLNKFEFTEAPNRSSDHRWFELVLPGLPKVATKVSQSGKPIPTPILNLIHKQLRVRKEFFNGMVSCTKSRDEYYQQIRQDPYPPFDFRF